MPCRYLLAQNAAVAEAVHYSIHRWENGCGFKEALNRCSEVAMRAHVPEDALRAVAFTSISLCDRIYQDAGPDSGWHHDVSTAIANEVEKQARNKGGMSRSTIQIFEQQV